MKTPYPQQIEGALYGKERGSGFLFMKPRTGKTLTTQMIMGDTPLALIIAPASVLATWEASLLEEGVHPEEILVMDGRQRTTMKNLRNCLLFQIPRFFLINFEKVVGTDSLNIRRTSLMALGLRDWDFVIVDESYRIANIDSGISRYLTGTGKNQTGETKPEHQKRFVLSGFPICETSLDIANQAIFTDGEFFGYTNPQEYRLAYWKWVEDSRKWVVKDPEHLTAISKWIDQNTFQAELEDLGLGGEIQRACITLPATETIERIVGLLKTVSTYRYPGDSEEEPPREMLPAIRGMFIQKAANGIHPLTNEVVDDSKYRWVADWWLDNASPRLLILARFTKSIERITEVLREEGASVGVIQGGVAMGEREQIRLAHAKGGLDVVVAQVKTVKAGLDFSHCDNMIYLNNSWGFDDRAQSELRLQNTQRDTPYQVVDVCMGGTNEGKIVHALTIKKQDVAKVMKGDQLWK